MTRKHRILAGLTVAALAATPVLAALKIDPKADIHPTAVLMGNITVGPYTRIGPKVVIQGDVTLGHHVQILGNTVINVDKLTVGNYVTIDYGSRIVAGRPVAPGMAANQVPDQSYIRDNCWVGMNATLRGARLEEGAAVGMRAVAEFGTQLERGAVLAPGAVTMHGAIIPAKAMAEGLPAAITRQAVSDGDRERVFGMVPAQWNHTENDRMAKEIDAHPPQHRASYPGIDGRRYWSSKVKVDPAAQIHPTAILLDASIGPYTRVGPYAVIARATIGGHCDIRANSNIRADIVIGSYCLIGERVHVGSSRDGGFDNPLWMKDHAYIGPGSVVHATKIDDDVYYGANAVTDYGTWLHRAALAMSGASILHDVNIREEAVVRGSPSLMDKDPGISGELRMKLLGFLPKRWLVEVNGPALEKPQRYEPPIRDWEPVNRGTVNGQVEPGAIVEGNVSVEKGARVYAGGYVGGNVRLGEGVRVFPGCMVKSDNLAVGAHTDIYDQAMIVDGIGKPPRIGVFSWINHMASIEGASNEDFALANIGVAASPGTVIGKAALLLNGAATYAGQQLPPRSITWGIPATVRVLDSTMRERMVFFYGRDWPTWERQAAAEELKAFPIPK
jgi:carbonic anhydrase/acetyltransferase-like protein (isoleucine patch superfamily)